MDELIIIDLNKENEDAFWAMVKEYLPHSNIEKMKARRLQFPKAFKLLLLHSRVIGVVYGWPRMLDAPEDEAFTLDGIAIESDFHRNGYGKILLYAFEKAVREYGFSKVSVGSADGYVEHFYMECGYRPVQYKIYKEEHIEIAYEFKSMEEYFEYQKPEFDGFMVFEKQLI